MPKIWNKKHDRIVPPGAVYVGRPTKWGNPFFPGNPMPPSAKWIVANREEAIAEYERWIWLSAQTKLRAAMRRELKGKDLVCWCAPLDCHARIIIDIANGD